MAIGREASAPASEAACNFYFTFDGLDVELRAGVLDLNQFLADERSNLPLPAAGEVEPECTRRFVMSPSTFLALRKQVEAIAAKMREEGVLPPEGCGCLPVG